MFLLLFKDLNLAWAALLAFVKNAILKIDWTELWSSHKWNTIVSDVFFVQKLRSNKV